MACGIAMLVESIIWQYKDSILTADLGDISNTLSTFRTASFAILLAFSCTAFLVGLSGAFCLCKPCHKDGKGGCCWPIFFGSTLFIVWVIWILIGAFVTGVSFAGPNQIQQFCDGTAADPRMNRT